MTLKESAELFLDELTKSRNTKTTYKHAIKLFLEIVGDDAPLSADLYKTFLIQTKELSWSTQKTYAAGIRMFLESLDISPATMKRYTHNYSVPKEIKIIKYDEDVIHAAERHAERMGGGLIELRNRAIFFVAVDTGLRESEIASLKRKDLNHKTNTVIVIGKRKKEAIVRFSNRAADAIRRYLSARAELDGGTGKPLETLPLFARHDKGAGKKVKPVSRKTVWQAFNEILEAAGLPRKSERFHSLRHHFVTSVLRSSGNLKAAQELARHESILTTQRYAHLSNHEIDMVYDAAFNSPPPSTVHPEE